MNQDPSRLLMDLLDGHDLGDTEVRALTASLGRKDFHAGARRWLQMEGTLRNLLAGRAGEPLRASRERLLAKALLRGRQAALMARRKARRLRLAGALTAAAAVMFAVIAWWALPPRYPGPRASGGLRVEDGDKVRRGATVAASGPKAVLELGGYCRMEMDPGCALKIEGQRLREEVMLLRGRMTCQVDSGVGAFAVRTDMGTVTVKGTRFVVDLVENRNLEGGEAMNTLFVKVLAGAVLVASTQGWMELTAGEETEIPEAAREKAEDARDRAKAAREQAEEARERAGEEGERGEKIAELARKLGPQGQGLYDLVDAATQSALKPLEDVLAKVPEEAKPAIGKAIEEVRAGNAAALKALRKDLAGIHDEDAAPEARGREMAKQRVAEATKKHTEVLTGLLDEVPEEARPAIKGAIDASRKAQEARLEALGKAGKPEGVGKPEGKPDRPTVAPVPPRPVTPPVPPRPVTPSVPPRPPAGR
jgi:hypothetical protein